jgi:hypothetical protein
MSDRSSLSFIITDQYLTELWPWDLEFSRKFLFSEHFYAPVSKDLGHIVLFCFFWINFEYIKMKLGVIVNNDELRSSFSFIIID